MHLGQGTPHTLRPASRCPSATHLRPSSKSPLAVLTAPFRQSLSQPPLLGDVPRSPPSAHPAHQQNLPPHPALLATTPHTATASSSSASHAPHHTPLSTSASGPESLLRWSSPSCSQPCRCPTGHSGCSPQGPVPSSVHSSACPPAPLAWGICARWAGGWLPPCLCVLTRTPGIPSSGPTLPLYCSSSHHPCVCYYVPHVPHPLLFAPGGQGFLSVLLVTASTSRPATERATQTLGKWSSKWTKKGGASSPCCGSSVPGAGKGLHSADRTLLGGLCEDFGSTVQSHGEGCLLPGPGPPKRTQPMRTRSRGSHGPREPPFPLPSLHSPVLTVAQTGAQSLQTQWGERVRGYGVSPVGPRERSLLANTPSSTHLIACEQTQMHLPWHSRLFQPPLTSLFSLQGYSSPPPVHPRSDQASRTACWPPCPCLCWGPLPGCPSPEALPPPVGSPPSGWPPLGSRPPCLAGAPWPGSQASPRTCVSSMARGAKSPGLPCVAAKWSRANRGAG